MIKIMSNVMDDYIIEEELYDIKIILLYLIKTIYLENNDKKQISNENLEFYIKIGEDAYEIMIDKENELPEFDKNNIEIIVILKENYDETLNNENYLNMINFLYEQTHNFVSFLAISETACAGACAGGYYNNVKTVYNNKYNVKSLYYTNKNSKIKGYMNKN